MRCFRAVITDRCLRDYSGCTGSTLPSSCSKDSRDAVRFAIAGRGHFTRKPAAHTPARAGRRPYGDSFLTDGRFREAWVLVSHRRAGLTKKPMGEVLDPLKLLNSYGIRPLLPHRALLLESYLEKPVVSRTRAVLVPDWTHGGGGFITTGLIITTIPICWATTRWATAPPRAVAGSFGASDRAGWEHHSLEAEGSKRGRSGCGRSAPGNPADVRGRRHGRF